MPTVAFLMGLYVLAGVNKVALHSAFRESKLLRYAPRKLPQASVLRANPSAESHFDTPKLSFFLESP